MRKARLLYLTDKYEEKLISSTGKHKEDYIGQIGKIRKVQHLYDKTTHWIDLFDIEFDLDEKTVYVSWFGNPKDITIAELKAIQQQMKELGWL